MILKNITTRKTALRTGLLFYTTVEMQNDEGHIYRRVADIPKGLRKQDVAKKLEELAKKVRDV